MIIVVEPGCGVVELIEPREFKRFFIRAIGAKNTLPRVRASLGDMADIVDESEAWISERALRTWDGLADQEWWQDGLSAMIDKAAPYGWVDEIRGRIKAHIEWL